MARAEQMRELERKIEQLALTLEVIGELADMWVMRYDADNSPDEDDLERIADRLQLIRRIADSRKAHTCQ